MPSPSPDFKVIAKALLEKQLNTSPNENQNHLAFGLQDSYQSRTNTAPGEYGYEYENFSLKQKEFIYSIADALMELCKERYGSYEP